MAGCSERPAKSFQSNLLLSSIQKREGEAAGLVKGRAKKMRERPLLWRNTRSHAQNFGEFTGRARLFCQALRNVISGENS